MVNHHNLKELEKKTGYTFRDFDLFRQALTHSSYANEHKQEKLQDNERLEFLGDAVLEIVSSEFLFFHYPGLPEGDLTKLRASIVCEPTLALCTRELNLGDYLLLGKGEERTGGRNRDSIVSDAMEALIGAIYLDGGFASAKEFVCRFVMTDIEHKKLFYDSKTILQEIVQSDFKGEEISYDLTGETGPDHDKKFLVDVMIGDTVLGHGIGRTKKAAEQEAAYQAIIKLKGQTENVSEKN
ncbi:MAG: ribonuclease III [Blautia sp.]|nr:ribonuclease III [Blautia sp.]MDY4516911.1 ribonuclease III [Lachnospiraceae bacterium]